MVPPDLVMPAVLFDAGVDRPSAGRVREAYRPACQRGRPKSASGPEANILNPKPPFSRCQPMSAEGRTADMSGRSMRPLWLTKRKRRYREPTSCGERSRKDSTVVASCNAISV